MCIHLQVRLAFDAFDREGDGYIQAGDVFRVCKMLGHLTPTLEQASRRRALYRRMTCVGGWSDVQMCAHGGILVVVCLRLGAMGVVMCRHLLTRHGQSYPILACPQTWRIHGCPANCPYSLPHTAHHPPHITGVCVHPGTNAPGHGPHRTTLDLRVTASPTLHHPL